MTTPSRRWRRTAGLLAAALVGLLAVGACSRNDSGTTSGAPAPGMADENRADPPAEGGGTVDGVDGKEPAPQPTPGTNDPSGVQDRALIYTGSLTLTSTNVVKAADDAIALATAAGAIVSADQRTLDDERSSIQLVFRVPSVKFAATMDALAKLGDEQSRRVQTQDVTEQIIDLDARMATQQASVDRVRSLLARAATIGEIVALESELARREAELDSLKQRRAKLGGLVSLSTITMNLLGPAAPTPAEEEDETGFLAGLQGGWKGFLESVKIVLTVVGFLLPWALAVAIPVWLIIWVQRRRKSSKPPASRPPLPAGSTPNLPSAPPPAE